MDYRIEYQKQPGEEDCKLLVDGLTDHAIASTGSKGFETHAFWLYNPENARIGGCVAFLNWNWLYISLLWIEDSERGKGLGRDLLLKMENFALENNCQFVHLDTFSFQAPDFYKKMGYEQFTVLDDYPSGCTRHFFKKKLL